MQHTPVVKTVRLIILSVGFLLFFAVALRAAHQAGDPRYVKGSPYAQQLAADTNTSAELSAQTASEVRVAALNAPTVHRPASQADSEASASPAGNISSSTQTVTLNNGGNMPHGKALGVDKHAK